MLIRDTDKVRGLTARVWPVALGLDLWLNALEGTSQLLCFMEIIGKRSEYKS